MTRPRPRRPPCPVVSPLGEDRFLVRADAHGPLCDLLARVPRPPGRGLRIEVDPASLAEPPRATRAPLSHR